MTFILRSACVALEKPITHPVTRARQLEYVRRWFRP